MNYTKTSLIKDNKLEKYLNIQGVTVEREEEFDRLWVLRDSSGKFIDKDQYRYDLAERNNIRLLEY